MGKIEKLHILEFIEVFKSGFNKKALIKAFTQGNCYHFAVILKNIYHEGRIVHDNIANHFMLELDNKLYDIRGIVEFTSQSISYWDEMKNEDKSNYIRLIRDCVYKIPYTHDNFIEDFFDYT